MEGCPHYILPPFPECFSCLLLKMALTEVMLWCCQAWLFAPFAEIRTMTLALSSSRYWWSWGRRREAQSHVSLSSFLLNVSEDSTASRTVSQSSCCPWVMRVKEKKNCEGASSHAHRVGYSSQTHRWGVAKKLLTWWKSMFPMHISRMNNLLPPLPLFYLWPY